MTVYGNFLLATCGGEIAVAKCSLARFVNVVLPDMDERQVLVAGIAAEMRGRGGNPVVPLVTGMSGNTVIKAEVAVAAVIALWPRLRPPGGGRRPRSTSNLARSSRSTGR